VQGIVDIYNNISKNWFFFNCKRLQGANVKEVEQIIDESGLKVESVILLQEATNKVSEVLGQSQYSRNLL
jgi:succinyl-CoA synthetase beta subunit